MTDMNAKYDRMTLDELNAAYDQLADERRPIDQHLAATDEQIRQLVRKSIAIRTKQFDIIAAILRKEETDQ
jgi:hypothetical protein